MAASVNEDEKVKRCCFRAPLTTVHFGKWKLYASTGTKIGSEDIVLVKGAISDNDTPLCRVTSRCILSTAFNSATCDCAYQLQFAMRLIAQQGQGLIVYLDQEGRGHGLAAKLRAEALKADGFDTYSAFEHQGLAPDITRLDAVPQILAEVGVSRIVLLSSNPRKAWALRSVGVDIVRTENCEPVDVPTLSVRHLQAKAQSHKRWLASHPNTNGEAR